MKVVTVPGQTYVVYAAEGATITAPGVKDPLLTCEGGKPNYVTVPGGEMEISDPEATYAACRNFKNAALELGLLGGGLPAWAEKLRGEIRSLLGGAKVELHFNKQKRHLLILTDLADDSKNEAVSGVVEQYAPIDVSFEVFNLNKYAECTKTSAMGEINPDFKNDLTEAGEWIYPLPKLVSSSTDLPFANSKLVSFNSELPEFTSGTYTFYSASKLEKWDKDLPKLSGSYYMFELASSLKRFTGKLPTLTNGYGMFSRAYELEVFESDLSILSQGVNMFNGTKLNKTSALRVLNTIPTHSSDSPQLTMGIHVDHQNDEEVLAAIALADIAQTPIEEGGKGWTLAIQWNGTPTVQSASTFGLRKPPIYAKLATSERPDGTIEEYLDWGHYVSNAEENGYQEFASLEEAYAHFNLEMETEE